MTHEAPSPTRIVILAAVDETDASDDVIRAAAQLGTTLPGAELHFIHVIATMGNLVAEDMRLERARAVIDKTAEAARAQFGTRVLGHLAAGTAWREIVQLGADLGADLIVVGSHRRTAAARLVLGSVSEQVVRKASCAVLVARPKEHVMAVPEVEPPCPDCLKSQKATKGEKLWCAQHEHRRKRVAGHVHYEMPQSFSTGAMLIRPE